MANYICLDIGGTKILGALVTSGGKIVCKYKKKTKAEKGVNSIEDTIIEVVENVLNLANCDISDIVAIAAGAPGVIDEEKGVILYAPNLPWRNYDIKSKMEQRLGVPFYIANDGNAGVLGEVSYGVAVNQKNVIGMCVGTGVGAGIIINNELYTGNNHAAAEIGHMCLNPEGPLCNCGQHGCLEAYSSKVAITREIKAQLMRGRKSIMSELLENKNLVKSKMLKAGIECGDELTLDVLKRASYYLAAGIGSLINIFNPSMVVLGGGVQESCGDFILSEIKKHIDKFAWQEALRDCKIVNSKLGDDAIIFGTLSLIEKNLKK